MRVALAAVLFSAPDLLLLDEPTNYLDLEGALWLVDYLKRYPATIIVISHDRDLLDAVADHILHLDSGKLTLWRGGYSQLRTPAPRTAGPARQAVEKAGGAAQAPAILRRPLPRQGDQGGAGADRASRCWPKWSRSRRSSTICCPSNGPRSREAAAADRRDGRGQRRLWRRAVLSGSTSRCRPTIAIGLLGANGNGKSTFAKLVGGRLRPMGGDDPRSSSWTSASSPSTRSTISTP